MNRNFENIRTLFTVILSLTSVVNLVQGQGSNNKSCNLLIGTYTTSPESDGLYFYDFDTQTGDTKFKSKIAGVENPSYLDISRDGKHLYTVNESRNGGISSFTFNRATGNIVFINHVSSGGAGPCC